MNLTKATQKCRTNNQELDHESQCLRFSGSLPNNQRPPHGRPPTERPPPSSPHDPNRGKQENPTLGHAAAPFISINVIMTLLKRGQLANTGAQAYEAPQPHHTSRSQIYK